MEAPRPGRLALARQRLEASVERVRRSEGESDAAMDAAMWTARAALALYRAAEAEQQADVERALAPGEP
jgi:hypothetical protein